MLALLGNLGPGETLLIAVVVILVFGGRLPDVARDAMRAFYKGRRALDNLRRETNLGGELSRIHRDLERSLDDRFESAKPTRPVAEPHPDPLSTTPPDDVDSTDDSRRDTA